MMGSAIREMAAARSAPLIAAAFYEAHAQIWDLDCQRMQAEFPIRFRTGSASLTMHPDGEFIVAGLSAKRGSVTAYTTNGATMWRRDEIEEGGFLSFDRSGRRVSFTRGGRESVERVDARSGVTVEILEHIDRYVDGPDDYVLLSSSPGPNYLIAQHEHKVSVPKLTFGLLDAAFSPSTVCITESGGPVRCVGSLTGAELWRYTPPNGSHVLNLHYNNSGKRVSLNCAIFWLATGLLGEEAQLALEPETGDGSALGPGAAALPIPSEAPRHFAHEILVAERLPGVRAAPQRRSRFIIV